MQEAAVWPLLFGVWGDWNAHFVCRRSARILDGGFHIIGIVLILKNSKGLEMSSAVETQNKTKHKPNKKHHHQQKHPHQAKEDSFTFNSELSIVVYI